MEIFYREYGEGRTILIFHGWLGLSDHWIGIGKLIADSGYRVIIPDLPNHGRSSHTQGFSYVEMASIMQDFIIRQAVEKPIIIGHSMGGKIALAMNNAVNNNFDYSGLILLDIHNKSYDDSYFDSNFNKVLLDTNPQDFSSMREALEYFQNQNLDKSYIALLIKNLERRSSGLRWKPNLPMLAIEDRAIRGSVEVGTSWVPSLLVRGGDSNYVSNQDIIDLKRILPRLDVETIPSSGHWLHVDRSDKLVEAILGFLKVIGY